MNWELVLGAKWIYVTKHYITYDGGSMGGYVVLQKKETWVALVDLELYGLRADCCLDY